MNLRSPVQLLSAVLLLAVSAACARPASEIRYPLSGVVIGVDAGRQTVDIAHEAIEGFMPAMAMPFAVRGTLPPLSPDDRVSATLVVTGSESWLENLIVTRRADAAAARPSSAARRLEGAAVPDVRLRTQDDRPFAFSDLAGRVALVTFIYTRCPLPDYCPRMMSHLDAVKRAVDATPARADRTRLIAITLDPAFDTPAVLKAYGERFITGPDRFARVTLLTGSPAEIQAVAGFFNVKSVEEAGQISHSLSTAVIGADGRVATWFPGNAWKPEEAIAAIDREIGRMQ